MRSEYSLYLQVGNRVYHKRFRRWGMGVVVEERASEVPGGFCYVRIGFQDGKLRVFDNNLKSVNCCYYAGVVKIDIDEYSFGETSPSRRSEKTEKKKFPVRKALPKGNK